MKENNQALCLKLMNVDLIFEVEWAALLKDLPKIYKKNCAKNCPKKS